MLSLISNFLLPWKSKIIAGVGIAMLTLLILNMVSLRNLRAENASLKEDVSTYQIELKKLQRVHEAQMKAVNKEMQNERKRTENFKTLLAKVNRDEDGAVAPVLINTFERMFVHDETKTD